jgi:putative PEP-CTERM system histidine kinase
MLQTTLSTAAIFLALLCALLVALRNRGALFSLVMAGALLLAAGLELFDLLALNGPEELYRWKWGTLVAEALLPLTFLLFSLTFARRFALKELRRHQKILLALALLLALVPLFAAPLDLFYSPDFETERLLFLEVEAFVFYIALLVFLVIPLINLEATLANAPHRMRWSIKLVVLGMGCYVAALIFYYSQGLLYRTINMNLLPFRSMALITAALLVGYSQAVRGSGVRITVSRNIAFQSLVLLAVSLYLIGLGLLGEGMKYFGESFQRSLLMGVGLLTGVGLLVVLLSEQIKRKIKLFLTRHFYEDKHDYRDQWLQFTTRMSMPRTREELYSAVLLAFGDTFGMGCGALFLKDYTLQQFVAVERMSMDPVPVPFSTAQEPVGCMAEKPTVFRMGNGERTLTREQKEWVEENQIRFLVPLCLHETLDGFVALGRPINPGEEYTEEDTDLMMAMVRQTASTLLNFRLAEQLSQARDMEAVGKVSAFVAHDLKNLVYSLSLMVENARQYLDDPEFQADMLQTVENTANRMKIIIAQLKTLPEKRSLDRRRTDLAELARETCTLISSCEVVLEGDAAEAVVDRDELHKVVLNLLLNAVDAMDGRGTVFCRVGVDEQGPFVAVEDSGCGMEEEFLRGKLFQPFVTTKKKGLGIGLYQCKQIIEAHGGRIEVRSTMGEGSVFTVRLPGASADKAVEEAA